VRVVLLVSAMFALVSVTTGACYDIALRLSGVSMPKAAGRSHAARADETLD
jgi:hypothetical protein